MTEPHPDEETLSAVRGLGQEGAPDEQARARADELDDELDVDDFDLRGSRDRDPDAAHPWRTS